MTSNTIIFIVWVHQNHVGNAGVINQIYETYADAERQAKAVDNTFSQDKWGWERKAYVESYTVGELDKLIETRGIFPL